MTILEKYDLLRPTINKHIRINALTITKTKKNERNNY
jgi:hypothetical protein